MGDRGFTTYCSRGLACIALICLCIAPLRSFAADELKQSNPIAADRFDRWAFKPLRGNTPPASDSHGGPTSVDAFILAKLKEKGLAPSPEADRRTLIRRLSFDLIGLPPSPEDVDRFIANPDPHAYEELVDELLASPAYGERWARHWLDVVHYGDTHGYDKDKIRENAWPYRDYVIRSFNEDKPYDRFVKEQIAGDFFYPSSPDGIAGLGFLAAGPWDFVGQAEVREDTLEKARVRNIDRDDMVSVTMNTFVSLTAQCARCHNHKFDPISQEDYYSLQAVFAAVDRADRPFDADLNVAKKRRDIERSRVKLLARRDELDAKIKQACGAELTSLDQQIAGAAAQGRPEYGYHSAIELRQDAAKWVQVDLGSPTAIDRIVVAPAHDTFNDIGAGFGFPVRFKVETSNDPAFATAVTILADYTSTDFKNPGTTLQSIPGPATPVRFVRITATKLAPRLNDFIFALAELKVLKSDRSNAALAKPVTSLDSIEAAPRWGRGNLVDGVLPGASGSAESPELARLQQLRADLIANRAGPEIGRELLAADRKLAVVSTERNALPSPTFTTFAASTDFESNGEFRATFGAPRPIHLLLRGNESDPKEEMSPGTVGAIKALPARFDVPPDRDEAERRAALANWIIDENNPLTWRSIVNRVWHYHFGRGIVETPNDFGWMGADPTHPELLDYLAKEFRDNGRSLKRLHRLIVTSGTYRQSSANNSSNATIDAGNQFLWRQNRQRLSAEAIHDTVLSVTGLLDRKAGGPGFKAFGFEDDHSPRYKYAEFNPDDPASHRRSIYRLIVRSAPDPFMETLDCADPTLIIERRNETLTALQALALLNNKFIVRMSERFAERIAKMSPDVGHQIIAAYRLALSRQPTREEVDTLSDIAHKHGLPNACRLIFNTNEFAFTD
jgi:hypothetical protein